MQLKTFYHIEFTVRNRTKVIQNKYTINNRSNHIII
jgi:hypothetical protein